MKYASTSHIDPQVSEREYLDGLFRGNPPSVHVRLYVCRSSHRWRSPTVTEAEDMFRLRGIDTAPEIG